MPEAIRPYMLHIAVIAGSAMGLYFFWKFCRAVVKWGFFVAYFVTGCLLAWRFQPDVSLGVTLTGGLAFAWTVMAIKSKLWKIFGAVAVILAMQFFSPAAKAIGGWATKEAPLSTGQTVPAKADKRR